MNKLWWMAVAVAATPALAQQVCNARAGEPSSPTSQFTIHQDGTVTDKRSKLMWMRCSAGQAWVGSTCTGQSRAQPWAEAMAYAEDVNRRGQLFFNDWRLPSVRELATVTERQCSNPRINTLVFPRTVAAAYWTTSPRPGTSDTDSVYVMNFGSDGIDYVAKTQVHHVRLVRGPE